MYLLEDCLHKITVKFYLITHQISHYVYLHDDAIDDRLPRVFNIFRYKVWV